MTQPEKQGPSSMQQRGEWLIAPNLAPGARLQISSLLEAEELTPEVLELLAKFTRKLQAIERAAPAAEPCPKLDHCDIYAKPCPELTFCGQFSPKVAAL
ncbi:MAG: hypothetical protein ACHQAY_23015 [Hyphomicrobiales bacterium]